MKLFKRLHFFVLKSFLPLFAMTFFIVLFIVLMQFLWRYIDDLVGKGLSMSLIGELFFYAAVSMVPMALPLAILLASLMTFGNFGERFELTAMKASGISLIRVMGPLIILISGVAVGAFYFQNDVLPKAQVKMWTLLFSMRQKSPEVEIPEGVFYDQIPGINLYVSHKNRDTGMLYDVKIYDVRRGGDNVTILVSDSARMSLTSDMKYIYLYLYGGNQYEKMQPNRSMTDNPFRRESYHAKEILIPFDANFNRMDEGGIRDQYVGKNIAELQHSIDSMTLRIDSVGKYNEKIVFNQSFRDLGSTQNTMPSGYDTRRQSTVRPDKGQWAKVDGNNPVKIDSLLSVLDPSRLTTVFNQATRMSDQKKNSMLFEAETMAQEKKILRRHGIELFKKFTLSVACLIFFFIGAPLGAIIRKGGIGMPLVISVLLFLVYYIIDNTGYKMARDGHAAIWFGMWLSTFILAPLGIFVTYKAMNDSAVFDPDRIKMFFRKLIGKREKRYINPKEVIINEVVAELAVEKLLSLSDSCRELLAKLSKKNFYSIFYLGKDEKVSVRKISEQLEMDIDYLRDCRDKQIINILDSYPVLNLRLFLPQRRLTKDLKEIINVNSRIINMLLGEKEEIDKNTTSEEIPGLEEYNIEDDGIEKEKDEID